MTNYIASDAELVGIANAIRSKKGTSNPIPFTNFASEIESISGGDTPSTYPEYVETEKEAVAARLRTLLASINAPVLIGDNTDQHIDALSTSTGAVTTRNGVAYGIRTGRDLTKEFDFDLFVLGGDTHGGSSGTIESMQASAEFILDQIKGADCPYVMLVGNHEGGQDNQNITRDQVFASHVTESQINNEVIPKDRTSGYYDIPDANIRVIFIDAFPRTQVNYLATNINSMLGSLLSAVPEGYKALIFSHHPLDETLPQNSSRTLWNNPTACHDTLQTYKDKIIACICGHIHNNLYIEDHNGITFIGTTCAGKYELNDGSSRTAGLATETAYDIFVIDQENEVIHAVRYGNGEDREISYHHDEVVPAPRGNILTNVTWTDGKRLNSQGELTDASGYSTTEYIEDVNAGDVLYFADGTLPMSTNAWTLYNDDGSSGGSKSAISTSDYGATYASGNMYFELVSASNGKVLAATWFAVNKAKNPEDSTYGTTRFGYGEIEFWESGYIKSVKLAYDGVHFTGTAKIRFTFPTDKKAVLDIRVNEPIEEE